MYLLYTGAYAGRGPKRIYGERLDPHAPPQQALRSSSRDAGSETCMYQLEVRHKSFGCALNLVLLVKTNLQTKRRAHVLLFSSDLSLGYEQLVDYYCLRFQLEFNFRDAKQYWGLEDWMNITPTAVTNAANLSLFMVNIAERLLREEREREPSSSILDLKAQCRGGKYVEEILKLLPEKPEPVLVQRILVKIGELGRIHARSSEPISS